MRHTFAPWRALGGRRHGGAGHLREQGRRRAGGGRRALLVALGLVVGCLGVTGPVLPVAAASGLSAAAGGGAAPTAPAAQVAPVGTIKRSGSYLTDSDGRVVILHGMTVPAGVNPTARDIDTWIGYGFTGVRLAVPTASGGRFPATPGGPAVDTGGASGASDEPGLDQAAVLIREFTDRGLRVVLRTVPVTPGRTLSTATLAAGLERLATRFRDTAGLLGFEVPDTGGDGAELANAVLAHDGHHLLWRDRAAPFDAAAVVAVNDPTGYLVGWKDGTTAEIRGLVATADAFGLSWFYDAPGPNGAGVGTAAPGAGGPAGTGLPVAPADVVRPYPVAVAGVPQTLRFDAARVLTVAYRTTPPLGAPLATGTATAISVPAWSYPTGYQVQVSGGRVTSARGAGLLCVVAAPGAARVEVRVSPAPDGPTVVPPSVAGADRCPAATGSTGNRGTAALGAGAHGTDGAAGQQAAGRKDEYSGPLLWLLPLAGAAATALLLTGLLRPWQRRLGVGPGPGPSPDAPPVIAEPVVRGD